MADRILQDAAVFRVHRRIAPDDEGIEFGHRVVAQAFDIFEAGEHRLVTENNPSILFRVEADRTPRARLGIERVRIGLGTGPEKIAGRRRIGAGAHRRGSKCGAATRYISHPPTMATAASAAMA